MATRSLQQYSASVRMPAAPAAPDPLPPDFLTALQAGWQIVGETTELVSGRKKRHGRIVLSVGDTQIQFEYMACSKAGFQFGKPELISRS